MNDKPPSLNKEEAWTVQRIITWSANHLEEAGIDSARLDAELLLAQAMGVKRIDLFVKFDQCPVENQLKVFRGNLKRRAAREPLAYITGIREFLSIELEITSDVMVPRPETEVLVEQALDIIKPLNAPRVLDLCTGSGAIAIAVGLNKPDAAILAADISDKALIVARKNVDKHNLCDRITLFKGDLFEALPNESLEPFDLITANPPYITSRDLDSLPPEVQKEPRLALDGGKDGLDIAGKIVEGAKTFLKPKASILMEVAPDQAEILAESAANIYANASVEIIKDYSKRDRVVCVRF